MTKHISKYATDLEEILQHCVWYLYDPISIDQPSVDILHFFINGMSVDRAMVYDKSVLQIRNILLHRMWKLVFCKHFSFLLLPDVGVLNRCFILSWKSALFHYSGKTNRCLSSIPCRNDNKYTGKDIRQQFRRKWFDAGENRLDLPESIATLPIVQKRFSSGIHNYCRKNDKNKHRSRTDISEDIFKWCQKCYENQWISSSLRRRIDQLCSDFQWV